MSDIPLNAQSPSLPLIQALPEIVLKVGHTSVQHSSEHSCPHLTDTGHVAVPTQTQTTQLQGLCSANPVVPLSHLLICVYDVMTSFITHFPFVTP